MTIRVSISHRTSYQFDRWVRATPHVVRLRPAPYTRTPILSYTQTIEPANHFVNWQQDPFGNYASRIVFPEPIHRLLVDVELIADVTPFPYRLQCEQWRLGELLLLSPTSQEQTWPTSFTPTLRQRWTAS